MRIIALPVEALTDSRLVHAALSVYAAGMTAARPLRTTEVVELTGFSRIHVTKCLRNLADVGLVERTSVLLSTGQAAPAWVFQPVESYRSATPEKEDALAS